MQAGIIAALSQAGNYDFNADMDMLLLSKCGMRNITPIVEMMLGSSETLDSESLSRMAALILSEYKPSWDKIRDALTLEYNPLSASIYHEELTIDTSGETTDRNSQIEQNDVSTSDTLPDNYISDGKNTSESNSSGTNTTKETRTLDRNSNGTSYKSSELLQSEIQMRINSRFTAQVIEDVKNYISMPIY